MDFGAIAGNVGGYLSSQFGGNWILIVIGIVAIGLYVLYEMFRDKVPEK